MVRNETAQFHILFSFDVQQLILCFNLIKIYVQQIYVFRKAKAKLYVYYKFLSLVTTSNYLTNLNMAPVPSVCVRVPHSPSNDSGKSDSTPSSPHEKHQGFSSLVVREFDIQPQTLNISN